MDDEADDERRTMRDVRHVPPEGEPIANVWHRGRRRDPDDEES